MAAKRRLALDPVADLTRRLAARDRTALRRCVRRWWRDQALGEHPAVVGKRIGLALLEQPDASAKLAGVVVLHELLADHLRASDLAAFEALFAGGALADRSVVDAFALGVLGTMLDDVNGRANVARAIASWRAADTMWQRRAACVAFTALAAQGEAALPGLVQHVFALCAAVVWSPEHVDQTAVGWLLCELSRVEPTRVETFFRRHARFMSRACARRAVAKLPVARQKDLLAHWKRATSLAR